MSLVQAVGPILTPETTGHTPAAVLDAHLEHRRGTERGQYAPRFTMHESSCCQASLRSPLNGVRANDKP